MKKLILFITIVFVSLQAISQRSDFIVLKKKNNRTIKTFYPGGFIAGTTYNGFRISGYIVAIQNDSLYIRQEETRLVGTAFGYTLDTVRFTQGFDYREIMSYDYAGKVRWGGRRKGFAVITIPRVLMMVGGGYLVLETINTAYRKESFNDTKKLITMGAAAGAVVTGYLINYLANRNDRAGGKYKVVYVKYADIKL